MNTEQNKALMRRFVEEIFNRGNLNRLEEFMAPNFVEHEELPPGVPRDREGVKQLTLTLRSAFPDFKATIDDAIAEGDKLVVRQTWTGTHKGDFMGVPPSGKKVSFGVIDILQFSDGKILAHWGMIDNMGLMQQIGAIPAPGQR
jgi:steroid delta-isomerase-like uncharacterized protein